MRKLISFVFIGLLIPLISSGAGGYLIKNKGQFPLQVLYQAKLNYGVFFIEKTGFKITVANPQQLNELLNHNKEEHDHKFGDHLRKSDIVDGHTFYINFKNSNALSFGTEETNLTHKISSFLGNDESKWISNLTPIQITTIPNIYDKIDLRISFVDNSIKYDFIVKPGGDPNQIQIEYKGLEAIHHLKNKITLVTSVGNINDSAPYSYQEDGVQLKTLFKKINQNTFGIKTEDYDTSTILIIDPQLNFSTFSGSLSDNWGFSATYDDLGYAYAGGVAFGFGYPTTTGAFSSSMAGGDVDMTISKFSPNGKNLVASTYIGGNGTEAPHSMIVNSKRELIIYGASGSTDYPTLSNSFDKTFNGGEYTPAGYLNFLNGSDIVLTKLNDNFSQLLGSTYFGGSKNDGINDGNQVLGLFRNYGDGNRGEVIVDDADNIIVSSVTHSSDLPTKLGFQNTYGGGTQDGCVMRFNSNLSELQWGSYFGGSGDDGCYSIKENSQGDLYISGGTTSSNLKKTGGSFGVSYKGSVDGFLAKISSNGSTLKNVSYIGTSNYDQNYLVDVDSDDKVYCFGQSEGNMPVSDGVYNNAGSKQFIHKYNSNLSSLELSTVIGNGSAATELVPTALLVSDCKEIFISGWGGAYNDYMIQGTNGFPITDDAYQKNTDGSDFYIMVLGKEFSTLNYSTFLGGLSLAEHVDGGTSRFDKNGTIYQSVCAVCDGSSSFPVSPGAYSEENNSGSCNVALVKMDASTLTAQIEFNQDSIYCSNSIVMLKNKSTGGKSFEWIYPDGSIIESQDGQFEFLDTGTFVIKLVALDPSHCPYSDTTQVAIEVTQGVDLNIKLDSYDCKNKTLILSVDGPDNNKYEWGNLNGSIPGNQNSISLAVDNSTYFYVNYDAGCGVITDEITIPLLIDPLGTEHTGDACAGDTAIFPFESFDVNTYRTVNSESFFFTEDSVNFPTQEDQSIYLETTTLCGIIIDTFKINAFTINSETTPDLTVCRGERVSLSVESTADINWIDTITFQNPNIGEQVIHPDVTQSYLVELNENNCSVSDTITVSVLPVMDQSLDTIYTVNYGENINVNLNTMFDYQWHPTNYLSCQSCPSPTITPDEDITYFVSYYDTNNCFIQDTIQLQVIFPLYIPNSFTPNGDFKNDFFRAESHLISDFEMFIFNRWGSQIFHTNNIYEGWDGTLNNEDQQIDVYIYKIIYKKVYSDKNYERTGIVTLLR
jgi:gliding motility-associated-like protein